MRGIRKAFHGVPALKDVSLTIYPGEVHALMGENGAGKSTLMKILAGAYTSDGGEIAVNGHPVRITHPSEARRQGISLIYQELNVAPNLTVAENIFMGQERTRGLALQKAEMEQEANAILQNLGASFDGDTRVSHLSIAEQQQVEIARALKDKARILVMDEPTAALSDRETERLFEIIRRLRADGIAIIYISHRMEEVYALADRVSVLRDGEYIGTLDRSELSADRLVQMMVGRPLQDFYEHHHTESALHTEVPLLEVVGLTDGSKIQPASFQLYAGEILGLAGLVGAGRTELARLIFGADPKAAGEIRLEGRRVNIHSPTDAIHCGIGYVPEDRKDLGLFLEMSARENIAMNVLDEGGNAGIMNLRQLQQVAERAIGQLSIRLASPSIRALDLSGGNQQKLLLARWLAIKPKVLLLDEPTRGVDIGAKSEIYRIISELAAQGVGILMISSELTEIIGMSDRVLIMREGRLVGEINGQTEAITQENVMSYATGVHEREAVGDLQSSQ